MLDECMMWLVVKIIPEVWADRQTNGQERSIGASWLRWGIGSANGRGPRKAGNTNPHGCSGWAWAHKPSPSSGASFTPESAKSHLMKTQKQLRSDVVGLRLIAGLQDRSNFSETLAVCCWCAGSARMLRSSWG